MLSFEGDWQAVMASRWHEAIAGTDDALAVQVVNAAAVFTCDEWPPCDAAVRTEHAALLTCLRDGLGALRAESPNPDLLPDPMGTKNPDLARWAQGIRTCIHAGLISVPA